MANGKSDLKLTDDFDGQVKVEAPDLCVDGGQGRRKGSTTPYRRALVHDGNDGLTINWANDYQGGVTINGNTQVLGNLKTNVQVQSKPIGLGIPSDGKVDVDLTELLSYLVSRVGELENHIQVLANAIAPTILGPPGHSVTVSGQDNWRWCKKCEGLFFAGHPTHGKCPADSQPHSQEGSGDYRLLIQSIPPPPPNVFVPH